MAGGQGCLTGGNNGIGGGEIRLADLQVDDVMARRLELIGPRQQRHDMKGFDGATARAEGAEQCNLSRRGDGENRRF